MELPVRPKRHVEYPSLWLNGLKKDPKLGDAGETGKAVIRYKVTSREHDTDRMRGGTRHGARLEVQSIESVKSKGSKKKSELNEFAAKPVAESPAPPNHTLRNATLIAGAGGALTLVFPKGRALAGQGLQRVGKEVTKRGRQLAGEKPRKKLNLRRKKMRSAPQGKAGLGDFMKQNQVTA